MLGKVNLKNNLGLHSFTGFYFIFSCFKYHITQKIPEKFFPGGGGTQHIRIRGGGQSKKFSGNPKISVQLHFNPKISAHFILRNMYMNKKKPETMQVKVRIASNEPRNISYTMFGVKKYHEDSFSFIWTQKYHFWQYSDPKISDLPPRMCMCWVPPPGKFLNIGKTSNNLVLKSSQGQRFQRQGECGEETLITQKDHIILRNFQYWPKFFVSVSYKNICMYRRLIRGTWNQFNLLSF